MKTSFKYSLDHIPRDTPCNRRPGLSLTPEYITIHSTGNPGSTARNERAWLTNPGNKKTASWHLCIDEREAVEAIPLGEVAWHAGDGGSGPGNRGSIAVEICESGERGRTLENAVELVAGLLQKRNWGPERLRRHWDWSGKACPRILMAEGWAGWERFKKEVQKRLEALAAADGSRSPSLQAGKEALPRIQRRVEGILNGSPAGFEAYLINDSTYVPLRPLAAALGWQLEWKEGRYHIRIP
jgi:N-acetylmuramoyl-L-alanine amidase